MHTVEPLLRGHPDERPLPLERPHDKENLNIKVLISTPDERPPLLKGHFSDVKGVASQEGFHCIYNVLLYVIKLYHIFGKPIQNCFKFSVDVPWVDPFKFIRIGVLPVLFVKL